MKRTLLIAAFLFLSFGINAQEKAAVSATNTHTFDETGKFWIYNAHYIEWGHLPICRGWGLCNYQDCWFCDVADKHTAKVLINPKTKAGEMLIELNPADATEKKAIVEKLVFTVSENIDKPNSIVYKGLYQFDSTVGKYGGYRLKITLK